MLSKTKVKYIQSLAHKKSREAEGVFIAEGPKIVNELIHEPGISVREIFALPEWIAQHTLPAGFTITEISPVELEKISTLSTPNQVLAIFNQPPPITDIDTSNQLVLLLDGIQDPGNMGTIIRIADWFGISQLVCSTESAHIYNPKVIQSSMASIARVRVLVTDLEQWVADHPELDYYAAALQGKDITQMNTLKQGVLMIGNESKGLHPGLLEKATQTITIPRIGRAESLNAAVATGIILSHLVKS